MERFISIHGHFYQPPRENPWLESIELQRSAYPYHDWNERITAECYAPNASARLLGSHGRIERIVNNYSRISFNFGPTLLAWMREKAPAVHDAIILADQESRLRFSGHGSALAQCYNHLIMPLANARDQRTQVAWGVRDFEFRFGRSPEGMWLPETAVNAESLEALVEFGIKFTILSPFQAKSVRALESDDWQEADGGRVDTRRPYLVQLPSGRTITVFFYDAAIAKAVAFERILDNGHQFARRLLDGFDAARTEEQLVHLATDGESYGHHHRHGEMALAYALNAIESEPGVALTNYGEFLERYPPTWEAVLFPHTSWSCAHGLERWKDNCGCNSGGHPGWSQEWRRPLREACDWLRDQLAPKFEAKAREFLRDPWAVRDEYIEVILDRFLDNVTMFFQRHGIRPFNEGDHVTAMRLLEMQRHAMLMYTSCGWFFDELSGIETVQVIQYAARAIQLAADLLGEDFAPEFLERLALAKSNIPEHGDGRRIYEKFVKPALIDREKVAAHYAISSLFESYPDRARIYSFTIEQEDRLLHSSGNTRLAIGRIKVIFEITHNSDVITYAVVHWGGHQLNCGVRYYENPEAYALLSRELKDAFEQADFSNIIRLMDRFFGESSYSLKSLFADDQHKVLHQILSSTRDDVYNTFRFLTDRYTPLLRFLADLPSQELPALQMAVTFVLNAELRHQFESARIDHDRVKVLLAECARDKVSLDQDTLSYALNRHLDQLSVRFQETPEDLALLQQLSAAAELAHSLPFEANLWKIQNAYYLKLSSLYLERQRQAAEGDEAAKIWVPQFETLGTQLNFEFKAPASASLDA